MSQKTTLDTLEMLARTALFLVFNSSQYHVQR